MAFFYLIQMIKFKKQNSSLLDYIRVLKIDSSILDMHYIFYNFVK